MSLNYKYFTLVINNYIVSINTQLKERSSTRLACVATYKLTYYNLCKIGQNKPLSPTALPTLLVGLLLNIV